MFDKTKYESFRLFKDEGFENGFNVNRIMNGPDGYIPIGKWTFPESRHEPSWILIQWYSKHCFINERKQTEPYIIADTSDTKKVVYNPLEKSLSMTLNARNVYKGEPRLSGMWPHLLIEQRHICPDYKNKSQEERRFYSAECDRIVAEMDIRLTEYLPTTNPEGINACQFVAYVYLQFVDGNFIYLGFNPFDDRGPIEFLWKKETGGPNMIYSLPTEITFGSIENSFNAGGSVNASDEWKHIEVDLTSHIQRVVDTANRDLIFGRKVSRDEFYFSGTNVGFEIHGNISCTMEIKNYNLVTYRLKEKF